MAFNGNPLIKLDGYYFLSQWLRLPNLMDRAYEWWRGSLRRIAFGVPNETAARFSRREQAIFAAFGLLSFIYTLALRFFIVTFLGAYLTGWFYLPGLLGAIALALFYARRPLRQSIAAAVSAMREIVRNARRVSTASGSERSFRQQIVPGATLATARGTDGATLATARGTDSRMEANMATQDQTTQTPSSGDSGEINSERKTAEAAGQEPSRRRRRLVPLAVATFVMLILCLPWNASVGAYGALTAVPEEEAIIRAPESATLIELRVRPGDLTAAGAVIGRMSDIGLEDQLAQTQAEIDRANADHDRLLGELKAREESVVRAEVNLRQRRRDYDESYFERRLNRRAEAIGSGDHRTSSPSREPGD